MVSTMISLGAFMQMILRWDAGLWVDASSGWGYCGP